MMVMRAGWLWLVAALVALVGPAGPAQAGQPMVLGTQVAARRDAPTVATTGSARSLYVLNCGGCHGFDGAGSAGVPDMRRLGDFLRVPGGREFVLKVPGVMGSGLDDAQVASVTNWVLNTLAAASIPPGHQPFDASEVKHARIVPLVDVRAARERLVSVARGLGIDLP
jgi:mono/diheme cytochrome c family protein